MDIEPVLPTNPFRVLNSGRDWAHFQYFLETYRRIFVLFFRRPTFRTFSNCLISERLTFPEVIVFRNAFRFSWIIWRYLVSPKINNSGFGSHGRARKFPNHENEAEFFYGAFELSFNNTSNKHDSGPLEPQIRIVFRFFEEIRFLLAYRYRKCLRLKHPLVDKDPGLIISPGWNTYLGLTNPLVQNRYLWSAILGNILYFLLISGICRVINGLLWIINTLELISTLLSAN